MISEMVKRLLETYKGHYELIKEYPDSPHKGEVEFCENYYSYSVKYSKKDYWKKVGKEWKEILEENPVVFKSEDDFIIEEGDSIILVFRNVDTGEYYSLHGTTAKEDDYKLRNQLKAGVFKLFRDRINAENYKKEYGV